MTLMDFYLSSNTIREFVLNLCRLSSQVFEISLNSSLITDELSNLGSEYKSYAVYSEKMNQISSALGVFTKSMLRQSTRVMEVSLEKTTCHAQIQRINDALSLMEDGENFKLVKAAVTELEKKLIPLDTEAADILGKLESDLRHFDHEVWKLWLLSSNLRIQVEYEEINHLTNINLKIDASLRDVEKVITGLRTELYKLGKNL